MILVKPKTALISLSDKTNIDTIVKLVYNKFEEKKAKELSDWVNFAHRSPFIRLNKIKFALYFDCLYRKKDNTEKWRLEFTMYDDDFYIEPKYLNPNVDVDYFNSDTLRELVVKYVNSKFVYDKCDNRIMRYEDYEEEQINRKIFHSNIECCVCYDNLSGEFQTQCNHYLCLDCYNQIKGKKSCPICKSCLCCGEQEVECEDDD